MLCVRACSECVYPVHSRSSQRCTSLTAIQVESKHHVFIKHDVYQADSAAVQISFLLSIIHFHHIYRKTEEWQNTINTRKMIKDLQKYYKLVQKSRCEAKKGWTIFLSAKKVNNKWTLYKYNTLFHPMFSQPSRPRDIF